MIKEIKWNTVFFVAQTPDSGTSIYNGWLKLHKDNIVRHHVFPGVAYTLHYFAELFSFEIEKGDIFRVRTNCPSVILLSHVCIYRAEIEKFRLAFKEKCVVLKERKK